MFRKSPMERAYSGLEKKCRKNSLNPWCTHTEEGDGTMVTLTINWELSDDAKVDDAATQAQFEMAGRMVLIGLKQFIETGKALTPEDKMKIGQDIAEGKAPTCAI